MLKAFLFLNVVLFAGNITTAHVKDIASTGVRLEARQQWNAVDRCNKVILCLNYRKFECLQQ